jgi:hypothetical protein
MKSPIYARDLVKDNKTDAFLGKGFEAMLALAESQGREVIVGYYLDKPKIE